MLFLAYAQIYILYFNSPNILCYFLHMLKTAYISSLCEKVNLEEILCFKWHSFDTSNHHRQLHPLPHLINL
jgi:hypothetical protein